jgi:hypothetical protein
VVALGQTIGIGAILAAPWIFAQSSRKTMGFVAGAIASFLIVMTVFGNVIYVFFKGGQ